MREVMKTLVPKVGGFCEVDTIEFEGELWLVPAWMHDSPRTGRSRPVRIICATLLGHMKAGPGFPFDYTLRDPLPEGLADGRVPPGQEVLFRVVESPDLSVETPSAKKLN